jgi:hypothetical protein
LRPKPNKPNPREPKVPKASARPSKSGTNEKASRPNEDSRPKLVSPPRNWWRSPKAGVSNCGTCDPNREFADENRLAAELLNREFSIFESTRLVEIADPVAIGEGSASLRSEPVDPRFDAHVGVALRENAAGPELFAGIWRPWPFQLLAAPPCHELDGPPPALTEGLPWFPNECHWPSPTVGDGPRAVANEELPPLPNECHLPSPTAEPWAPNARDEEGCAE